MPPQRALARRKILRPAHLRHVPNDTAQHIVLFLSQASDLRHAALTCTWLAKAVRNEHVCRGLFAAQRKLHCEVNQAAVSRGVTSVPAVAPWPLPLGGANTTSPTATAPLSIWNATLNAYHAAPTWRQAFQHEFLARLGDEIAAAPVSHLLSLLRAHGGNARVRGWGLRRLERLLRTDGAEFSAQLTTPSVTAQRGCAATKVICAASSQLGGCKLVLSYLRRAVEHNDEHTVALCCRVVHRMAFGHAECVEIFSECGHETLVEALRRFGPSHADIAQYSCRTLKSLAHFHRKSEPVFTLPALHSSDCYEQGASAGWPAGWREDISHGHALLVAATELPAAVVTAMKAHPLDDHVQKWAAGILGLLVILGDGTGAHSVRVAGAEEATRAALRNHPDPHCALMGKWSDKLLKVMSLTEAGFHPCAVEEALIRANADTMAIDYDALQLDAQARTALGL
jgi:hypothetical protein